jgi:hypothetical protein
MTKLIACGTEWIMSGVVSCYRGWEAGSSILGSAFSITAREYFHLAARYPADQQLILVILMTRGFAFGGRACAERVAFLLVLAKSRWYVQGDALVSYGSLVSH